MAEPIPKRISRIRFGVLGRDAILRTAACEVKSAETLRNDGVPAKQGVCDPRMGHDAHGFCLTCGQPSLECPGHIGYITLPEDYPVYNLTFRTQLMHAINCTCLSCHALPIKQEAARKAAPPGLRGISARLSALYKACSSAKKCEQCGEPRSGIWWNGHRLYTASEGSEATALQPRAVQMALARIDDATLAFMGYTDDAHPGDYIWTYIPVIPPCARPGVVIDDVRAEDDLTVKYLDILKTKQALEEAVANGHPTHAISELHAHLQMHLATLQRNDATTNASVTRSGRPTKAIYARHTGKTGRMRVNIQGKRVNDSARTVISGDPSLAMDEVGIPRSIAARLTVLEPVNAINQAKMQELLDDECINYIHRNGRIFDVAIRRRHGSPLEVEVGDKAERHLRDGDVVLFNRQPTLHRQGLMALKVRVLPFSTFRMNLAITAGYNADFDGDEMNCYVPRGVEARVEAQELMASPNHIVSAAAQKPIVAIIQDALLNAAQMSHETATPLTRAQLMHMAVAAGITASERLPEPDVPGNKYTPRAALSLCLPSTFGARMGDTIIQDGKLIKGVHSKRTLGATRGGVVHRLKLHFGARAAANFVDAQQRVANEYAMMRGASVGLGDALVSDDTLGAVRESIDDAREKIAFLVQPYAGAAVLPVKVERRVNTLLNACRDRAGHLVTSALDPATNNLLKMVESGSKGSRINVAQISGCVGQQNVSGARIALHYDRRTLPHFKRGDHGAEARGFIASSYLDGLRPAEFFAHAQAGREGLSDTALRTAESGYMQRRCIKALEDISIAYDGTVRDSDQRIIQFVYGDDNFDPSELERHAVLPRDFDQLRMWTLDELHAEGFEGDLFAAKSHMRVVPGGRVRVALAPVCTPSEAQWALLRTESDALAEDARACAHLEMGAFPVDIAQIVRVARGRWDSTDNASPPWTTARLVQMLVRQVEDAPGGISITFRAHLRAHLHSRSSLLRGITLESLAEALRAIDMAVARGRVPPGETVGIVAAQSLGEPLTQSTLNTFHHTGVAAMRATTQGLPRFRELLGATDSPQTPVITAPLHSADDARRVQRKLDFLRVGDIVVGSAWEVPDDALEPAPFATCTFYPERMPPNAIVPDTPLATVVLYLDPHALRRKAFSMDDGTAVDPVCFIAWRLEERLKIHVEPGDANQEHPVLVARAYAGSPLNTPVALERAMLAVEVHGTEGVVDVHRRTDEDTGETVLEMLGAQMLKVMGEPGVAGERVISNHVREVERVLGIEAARATLVSEMRSVIEGGGSSIDMRHARLVADLMTHTGKLLAVSRYGTNRSGRSTITRGSFEQTVETFMNAAANGACDATVGVSDAVFFGHRSRTGTGAVEVMYDAVKAAEHARHLPGIEEDDELVDMDMEAAGFPQSYDPFADTEMKNPFADAGQHSPIEPCWSPVHEAEGGEQPAWVPSTPPPEGESAWAPSTPPRDDGDEWEAEEELAYSPTRMYNADVAYSPTREHGQRQQQATAMATTFDFFNI